MPRFGIMTAPMQVDYHDVLRVWREADAIPEIEHAWLFDHLMPIGGDPRRTGLRRLDAALGPRRTDPAAAARAARDQQPLPAARDAGQDRRDRRHRLRRTARLRHRRRLRPSHPLARREYEAHGLPFHDFAHAVGSLAEACTVIRRLWTEAEPFDFDGTYVQLTGAFGNPKPVQRPHPPILIGGRSARDAARGRRARRPVEHPRRRHRRRRPAAARCWTATAPRSAATPPRSPARSTCPSPTTSPAPPGTRSAKRSTPASGTSSSGCRRPIPPTSHGGSPTSSSSLSVGAAALRSRRRADVS